VVHDPQSVLASRRSVDLCQGTDAVGFARKGNENIVNVSQSMGRPDPILSTAAAYDAIAERYAATWFDDQGLESTIDEFLRLLPTRTAVLDAGCGPGRDVRAMAVRGLEAVGIDISEGMLREARLRVPGGIFRRMNLDNIRYPPSAFSGVWACASLQHLPVSRAGRALAEFARVLRPDGILFVTVELGQGEHTDEYGRYRTLYSMADFLGMVSAAGFLLVDKRTVFKEKSTLPSPRPKTWVEVMARKKTEGDGCLDDGLHSCLLCPDMRFSLNLGLGQVSTSSILWGDDQLYLAPDLAPIIEGHLLLATTAHERCLGACSAELLGRVAKEQDKVRELTQLAYGEETFFLEHGPVVRREAGACIDHAHLHCFPGSFHVREAVERLVGGGQPCSQVGLQALNAAGQSYLYVEDTDRIGYAFRSRVAPSQFLRQVVASLVKEPEWRWQSSCLSAGTRERYRRAVATLLPVADSIEFVASGVSR
jgi:SAM-dependent methyltransferase